VQAGVQAEQVPAPLQLCPAGHEPHEPPQPSSPQVFPPQFFVQVPCFSHFFVASLQVWSEAQHSVPHGFAQLASAPPPPPPASVSVAPLPQAAMKTAKKANATGFRRRIIVPLIEVRASRGSGSSRPTGAVV
jgi:hypothetical protein